MRTLSLLFGMLLVAIVSGCNRSPREQTSGSEKPGETAFSISVTEDGIYALDLSELELQSQESNGDTHLSFSLTQGGKSVPYTVDGEVLVFYGLGPDSRYAAERRYILEAGTPGKLMASNALAGGSLVKLSEIWHKNHYEENQIYDGTAAGAFRGKVPVYEPWFWKTLHVSSGVDLEFDRPETQISQAKVRVALWGVTENPRVAPDHDLEVLINKMSVGEIKWDGNEYFTTTLDFDPGVLQSGTNILSLNNGDGGAAAIDISRIDWFEIDYLTEPIVENDRLFLPGVQGVISVSGFSGKPAVFDITDRHRPILQEGWDYDAEEITLVLGKPRDLLVVGPQGYLEASKVEPMIRTGLRSEQNQADMLIVAADRFLEPLEPLVEARRSQSLTVQRVTLEDIYRTFGDGQDGPDSIREFIGYTLSHWTEPRPRYLLLVGDMTYDYRGYLSEGIKNAIPAPMVPVLFSGETVSDNSLVDMDGDGRPEMAIGRWPVSEPYEVTALVNRTLAYEQGQAAEQAIFVADGTSLEFTNLNQSVLERSGFNIGEVKTTTGEETGNLSQAWNQGAWLVNYAGHGSLDRWGKEGILDNEQISDFSDTATSPPIVIQLTCLSGYFAHPSVQSLSETMLIHENGPVLVIGASSLTLSEDQQPFGVNLLDQLNNYEVLRIGDAFLQAKSDLDLSANPNLREVSDTFNLFGDPATLIVRPRQG